MDLSLDREVLIEAYGKDKNKAIASLYNESKVKIYRYIYFRVYNEEDAEDVVENVYIKLMTQLKNYDGKESITSWLYQIARTEIAKFWQEKYKVDDDFLKSLLSMQETSSAFNPEAEVKVKDILSNLPENYAKVLELRFLKGHSLQECSKELGLTVANIKVLQHRALKKAGGMLYD